VQPRDVGIIRDVWRYNFPSAPQILELWWRGCSVRAGQRRLSKLFEAGYLEPFRPISRRRSFPWVYQLGPEGHRLLQRHGAIPPGHRYAARGVYDYSRALHELQLNAWVIAYRRLAGEATLSWEGETDIDPPTAAKHGQLRLAGDLSVKGLHDAQARLVRPDAVLEVVDVEDRLRTFLVEYDRTRRVDRNFTKFRRYDAFVNWWWQESRLGDSDEPPFVVFVCRTASNASNSCQSPIMSSPAIAGIRAWSRSNLSTSAAVMCCLRPSSTFTPESLRSGAFLRFRRIIRAACPTCAACACRVTAADDLTAGRGRFTGDA
jgi:hypothetical protein